MADFATAGERSRARLLPSASRLWGVLLIALLLRMAAAAWWEARLPPGVVFALPDSHSYWELARTIAAGEPYQFGSDRARVFRAPGYPLILAGVMWISGGNASPLAARLAGAVMGTLAVGGVYLLARRLFDAPVAVLAALCAALYPGAIALSVFILSEAAFVPLMILHLALWVIAWQSTDRWPAWCWSLGSGLAAALATLARPSWLLFVPAAIVAGLLLSAQRTRHLELAALVLAGLILGMLPWWVRNAQLTGRFVPTTLQVGASLYDGLNPLATGGSNLDFVAGFERQVAADPLAEGETFEYRLDRRMRGAALQWARQEPGRTMKLAVVKFIRMWNVWPNEGEFRGWATRLLVAATYVPALALGLWGAWRFGRNWPGALCWLPAVYLTLLHVVFVSSLRYREPAMLPLLVMAAAAIVARFKPQVAREEMQH